LSTQASARSRIRATTPEQLAWVGLLRAHASTIRRFDADLVSEHGLTLNDYEVLLHLARAPERRLRRVDLAKSVLLTPSGITRLLEGLQCAGYVERATCASDARVSYAQLTDEGYEKLRQASKTHLEGIRSHFVARFSADELETLRELLERLPEGLDPAGDCAPPNA
jgi:DNA-binding MarR family transcriptional regulator